VWAAMTLPARDLASRLDAAQSILAGLSLATVSTLDAPSIYRDKLAASKHRRFRQRRVVLTKLENSLARSNQSRFG